MHLNITEHSHFPLNLPKQTKNPSMAAAFAALVSLENTLRLIYNHPNHSFHFEEKQTQSLGKSVRFLIDFMKSYDNSHGATKEAAEALEMQIAEDVIESHMDQIRSGKTRSSRFLLDLQKAIGDMDYMSRKTLKVRARSERGHQQQQSTYQHLSPLPWSDLMKSCINFWIC